MLSVPRSLAWAPTYAFFETSVNLIDTTLFGIDVWRLGVVAVLLLALLFYRMHGAKGAKATANARVQVRADNGELVYTDAPTVRLSDTQRIDRLHRVVTLKSGE